MEKKRQVLEGEGLLHFFEMHGRLGEEVYRRKRNGETEQYSYIYIPPGAETPLKLRTVVINSFANSVSNPQYKGYGDILRKLYYYTPYFITPGSYQLQGQTVFFIRKAGNYRLELSGVAGFSWEQRLCRRTMVKLNFAGLGEYEVILRAIVPRASSSGLECNPDQDSLGMQGEEIYCRRRFVVLESGGDVKEAYFEYLSEHLAEILEREKPEYERLKTYRRGLVAKTNIFLGASGTYRGQVYYMRPSSNIVFLRANYDHAENVQSQLFKEQKTLAVAAWKAESEEFKEQWSKQFYQWYDRNFGRLNRMMTPYMWYVGKYVTLQRRECGG